MAESDDALRALVADVAAAYFSSSHIAPAEIPTVIGQIATSLLSVTGAGGAAPSAERPSSPALTRAQIRKSLTPGALISFEDGKAYRTLRRHLAARGLTPEQYRSKWGLPADYPMVAPSYRAARAQLARESGLGQRSQQASSDGVAKDRRRKPQGAETPG